MYRCFYVLLVLALCACGPNSRQPPATSSLTAPGTVAKRPALPDTVWEDDSTYYVELLEPGLDSAHYIDALSAIALRKLREHPAEAAFDTAVLLNGYAGALRFRQGALFRTGARHALVQVRDADREPFLVFRWTGDWRLRQVLYVNGKVPDSAWQLADYDFDGDRDLALRWYYSAGRCNCGKQYCRRLYVYHARLDSLLEVDGVPGYLDFAFVPEERALYLGEHCDGYFGKFRIVNDSLQKVEEYQFYNDFYANGEPTFDGVEHRVYRNGRQRSTRRVANGNMPRKWQRLLSVRTPVR
ncbi:hypothetical protein [Flaviaesturariibacter amylovorans]|uniref:VCBS repeat-containing protein n=1 Tax=Flaviaesturariibacter amylovorans TaxID=1084520 RepID=A0ABP8GAR2_9BACT